MTKALTDPGYVYVASSWANPTQVAVCAALKSAKIEHYDFRKPEGTDRGFHWSEVMPSYDGGDRAPGSGEQKADIDEYLAALEHPAAHVGFLRDMDAMRRADTFILVLPCGRSSHLELGWAVGKGKNTAILLDPSYEDNKVTPELMYKMVDFLSPSLFDLLGWLGVED